MKKIAILFDLHEIRDLVVHQAISFVDLTDEELKSIVAFENDEPGNQHENKMLDKIGEDLVAHVRAEYNDAVRFASFNRIVSESIYFIEEPLLQ